MTADNKDPKKKPCTALAPYKPTPLAIPDTGSGTLADFIRAANRAPILTPEREHELAVRLHDKGDMEAAGELIMSHLPASDFYCPSVSRLRTSVLRSDSGRQYRPDEGG